MKQWGSDVVEMLQYIYGLLDLQKAEHILDLGCGDGYDLGQIAKLTPAACHLWGIDASVQVIEAAVAETAADERFHFAVGDAEPALPFDDYQFDVVFSKNFLECITQKQRLLDQVHRVLKEDGQVVFAHFDWDSQTIDGQDKAIIRKLVHAYADWQQAWMTASDGWMGRRLWSTFQSSRLFEGQIYTYVLTNTEFRPPYYGQARINDFRAMAEAGLIDLREFERFYQDIEQRTTKNQYFYSITMYIYVGRKTTASR